MTNRERKSFYQIVRDIDRRVIFLFIALAVIIPLLSRIVFPEIASPMVKKLFNKVESMPPGSKILLSFDYDPASEPELQPMATAWVRQCVERKYKMYFMALWPIGQQMTVNTIEAIINSEYKHLGLKEGIDYVNLGYKSGNQGVINVVRTDFEKLYSTDVNGTHVNDIPMMKNIRNIASMDLIINISAGFPGLKEWIQFGSDPTDVPIVGGSTAVQAPLLYPYYPNQIVGLLGGLKGAAEYEQLMLEKYTHLDDPDKNAAIVRMGPQAVAHIVIMLFIVIGNITFLIDKRRARQ